MSFNIIVESSSQLDFQKIHQIVYKDELPFDIIPMPKLGLNGGDALGICVPLKNASEATWKELFPILNTLRTKFHCDIYDLYGGQKLTLFNSRKFRKNLLLK